MIANAAGAAPAYSLGPLQERGLLLFAAEGDQVYEGQLVGIHSRTTTSPSTRSRPSCR